MLGAVFFVLCAGCAGSIAGVFFAQKHGVSLSTFSSAPPEDDAVPAATSSRGSSAGEGRAASAGELVEEGRALSGQGRFEEAESRFSAAIAQSPDDPELWFLRGKARYEQDDLAGAEEDLLRTVSLDAGYVAAHHKLGQIHRQRRDTEACIDAFTTVLRLDAAADTAWLHRAVCYEQHGDLRKARGGAQEACHRGLEEGCNMVARLDR